MSKTAASRIVLFGACVLALALPSHDAHARRIFDKGSDNTLYSENNAIEADVGAHWLNYQEKTGNRTLDKEQGWMPDFNFGVGFLSSENNSSWFTRNIYLRGDVGLTVGNTAYSGALCNSRNQCVAHTSTTDDTIVEVSGKVGRGFYMGKTVMVTPLVDLGYRFWERNLTGVGGYREEYGNGSVLGGVMFQYAPMHALVLGVTGEVGTTFSPALKALGNTYDLGSDMIWRVTGKAGYTFTSNCELVGTLKYQGFNYGESSVIGGYYEPYSETREIKALLGFAYHYR